MVKTSKKVAAVNKVTTKGLSKISAAKKTLKKVSYGAGVLAHKVRKAGKTVSPEIWKDAKKAVQKNIEAIRGLFAKNMKSLDTKKSAASARQTSQVSEAKLAVPATRKKATPKKAVKKTTRKTVANKKTPQLEKN